MALLGILKVIVARFDVDLRFIIWPRFDGSCNALALAIDHILAVLDFFREINSVFLVPGICNFVVVRSILATLKRRSDEEAPLAVLSEPSGLAIEFVAPISSDVRVGRL